MKKRPEIEKLIELMERLRGPGGCPWDRHQDLNSLAPFIIEEAYEVVSAIDSEDPEELKEEAGDLLFQVIFLSQLASERGDFTLADVIETSLEKMVRRHPHVFGETEAETPEEVLKNWAEIKKREKGKEAGKVAEGILSGVPESLPALMRAHKVSQKASRAGFDWKDVEHVLEHVLEKVTEELNEFFVAVRVRDTKNMEEELGDLLFTIVNVARFLEVNPEDALRKTVGKFIRRFHDVERKVGEMGTDPSTLTMDELQRLWDEAKVKDKNKP
jgi:tetrapyrrole methylase family protein/MazG family protein